MSLLGPPWCRNSVKTRYAQGLGSSMPRRLNEIPRLSRYTRYGKVQSGSQEVSALVANLRFKKQLIQKTASVGFILSMFLTGKQYLSQMAHRTQLAAMAGDAGGVAAAGMRLEGGVVGCCFNPSRRHRCSCFLQWCVASC